MIGADDWEYFLQYLCEYSAPLVRSRKANNGAVIITLLREVVEHLDNKVD